MTRKAQIGSISHGTLRTEDLLDAFATELSWLARDINDAAQRTIYQELAAEAENAETDDNGELVDADQASDLVNELIDAMNELAPPFCYFGASEGDGSDFGFWPSMESIEELPRVSDPSEVDAMGEECVFVNDHGNVTVYNADGSVAIDFV